MPSRNSFKVTNQSSDGNSGNDTAPLTITVKADSSTPPPDGDYVEINFNNFESGYGIWNDGGSDARRSSRDAAFSTGISAK